MSKNTLESAVRAAVAFVVLASACGDDGPPGETYYQRTIQPILTSCASSTAGCHSTNPDDPFSFAAGNLDLTSYEAIQKRPDVLRRFGPYPVPLLLIKGVGKTGELGFNYQGEFIPLEVDHVGGPILDISSDQYLTLLQWLENGATENGLPPAPPSTEGEGPCSSFVPADFDDSAITGRPEFDAFVSDVQPVFQDCNSGNCHGTPAGDFYLACGASDRELAWNFSQAQAFVDDPVRNSQLLNAPLAVEEGGIFHSGGEHFPSRSDSRYQRVEEWAESVGRVAFGEGDPGQEFFRDHVQPVLVKRGCSFEACHSPAATNDFKLRSGSQGFFSAVALERNYDILKEAFLAFEVPDVRRGRAVAKGILPRFGGIAHRGGPVLETPGSGGAVPDDCGPFDPASSTVFCAFQQWSDIERQALADAGEVLPLAEGDTVPLIYVQRNDTTDLASPLEFDTYQPDSDLRAVDALIGAGGTITVPDATGISLLDGCGVAVADADVSSPEVHPGGQLVTFSMRASAAGARQVYVVGIDGGGCTQVTATEADVGGIKIHNFDPAWSPDGQYILFASTRGTDEGSPAPTLSRQLFLPQSDIFRIRPDGSALEQMTFLTNSEVNPQTMREGRVIMTTEKVSRGFYQLAGRRINWDLTDYHPLLAQRAQSVFALPGDPLSTLPSVGYAQATDIREGFDGNFVLIYSDPGAPAGAGTLATFNRSVGTFEQGRATPGSDNYTPGYLPSQVIVDPAATGRVGQGTSGAYKSPYPLLDGSYLAAYSGFSGDLGTVTELDFDLVSVRRNALTGEVERTTLVGGAGQQVEGVLAIAYPDRELFVNFRQLVFGGGVDTDITGGEQFGVVHFPDAPLIFTLLNANLRRGRPVELFEDATQIAVYREEPPSSASPNTDEGIFESRVLLGAAPLAEDGSAKVRVPAETPLILELQDDSGNPVVTMEEEHQVGPGEFISVGVIRELFDGICGGCHGSISGEETDIFITPDVLTGASRSLSQNADADSL